MRTLLIITILIFSLTGESLGQCRLNGSIKDPEQKGIASASIFLPELNKGTISSVNGSFTLEDLPQGRFIIQASHVTYGTYTGQVELKSGENSLLLTLQPTIIETSETVISGGVYSNQHESALKIDIIRPREPGASATTTATELLARLPGIDMISKGQGIAKPSIRGLAMNNILVLENGFRIENYQYSDHHPLGVDDHGVSSIEVIKGPASLIYGSDAMGGVINFLSELPAPVGKIQGDYGTSLFSSSLGLDHSLGLRGSSQKWHAGIRLSQRSHADYLQGAGTFVPNTRFNERSMRANLGYSGKKSVHRVFIGLGELSYGISEHEAEDLISERGRKIEYFLQDFSNWSLSNSNRFFLGKTKLELNAAARRGSLLHAEEPEEVEIEMRLITYSLEAKVQTSIGEKVMLLGGLQGFRQNNLNLNDREIILLPNADITDASAFVLIEYEPFKRLKMQAGMRADQRTILSESIGDSLNSDYRPALDLSFRSPTLALGGTFQAGEHWLLRANVASSHRNPTLAELSSKGLHELRFEIGDATLSPQRSLQIDLSSHIHKSNVTMDVAAYLGNINGYIFISPAGDTTNEGYSIYRYLQKDARLKGAEFALHYHPLSTPWLHLGWDVSLVKGVLINGENLPYIPALKTNLELMLKSKGIQSFENLWVSLKIHRAAAQHNPAPEEDATNGYTLLNLHAGMELPFISKGCALSFGINNMLDIIYIDHLSMLKESGFNNPGRNLVLSLHIPFGTN